MKKPNSQSGFTFIQVLLAGSIGIALVYFLTSAMVNFTKSGNRIAAKMDLVQLKAMVTESLTDVEICSANFSGKTFDLSTIEEKKVTESIPVFPPVDRIWMHRNPSNSNVIAFAKGAGNGLTGEMVKEIKFSKWKKLEDGIYMADLELVPFDHNGPIRGASIKGIEFQFPKKARSNQLQILGCRKVGGLSEPPNQIVFPAVGSGGGFPQRGTAEIANMTCHHAFGPTFECELKETFQSQLGDRSVTGGIYRCGASDSQRLCDSPN